MDFSWKQVQTHPLRTRFESAFESTLLNRETKTSLHKRGMSLNWLVMNRSSQFESQPCGWIEKVGRSELTAYTVLMAAFLPVTLPNFWASSWRHSLVQLVLWIAVFGNRRLAVLMLIPFYLVMPALVFVSQHFGPPNLKLLVPVRDSLFNERRAFLEAIPLNYYWLFLFMAIPVGAVWFFTRQQRKRTPGTVRIILLIVSM